MSDPVWVTPAGNLGDVTSQKTITNINLSATPVYPASTVFYKLYQDTLPPGLTLSVLGVISGVPNYVTQDTTYGFTVQAYDNLGNTSLRDFNIAVKNPNPIWITPSYYILNGKQLTNTSLYNNIVWDLGTFPSDTPIIDVVLRATPVTPSNKVSYKIISGKLPTGVTLVNDSVNNIGILQGTPTEDVQSKTYSFVVRATDNNKNISDRSFSMTVVGSLIPYFTTESGALTGALDSIWYEYQIEYVNPAPTLYPTTISIASGELPPGLEINEAGLIRGYPTAPVVEETSEQIETAVTKTNYATKTLTCLTTSGFKVGRPIRFSGSVFGGITEFDPLNINATTYYVKEIVSNAEFTISATIGGPTFIPSDAVGIMDATLPATLVNNPVNKVYNFVLRIDSELGNILRNFYIQITNQNLITGFGNIRTPVIYNTRPFTYNINQDITNYGFYVLPPFSDITGDTYPLATPAEIGQFYSNNFFTFKILGYDFDNDTIEYVFDIPLSYGITGDSNTGWISGTLNLAPNSISTYQFTVRVRKKNSPTFISDPTNFSMIVSNNIDDTVVWVSDSNLGNIFNGTTSVFKVEATNSTELEYELVSGTLPDNLTLLSNGEIVGNIAFETTNDYVSKNTVTSYTFTVNAFNPDFKTNVQSSKEFTIDVVQKFIKPTDSLYIQCTPSIADRQLIYNLLNNTNIIPNSYLYRPDDSNFGKANNVTYVHAYGIYASSIDEYLAAVQIQHYNRNITLGPLKTAVARNEKNEIIYEVVYSEIIDNLVNPQGVSINKEINWPFYIDLHLGPWYTSLTDVYTSYIYALELDIITQDRIFWLTTQDELNLATNQGDPTFYTSLSPGYARLLYPNSLENMRKQVEDVIGVDPSAALLPLWMSSQQENGSTLGYTKAWVIAYCKPGTTTLPNGAVATYAERIKYNIENNWTDELGNVIGLNLIDFQLDRFTVNKSLTYDYDNNFDPAAWTNLPSGVPQPNPINSKDFQILFPRKTILPNKTAYPKA